MRYRIKNGGRFWILLNDRESARAAREALALLDHFAAKHPDLATLRRGIGSALTLRPSFLSSYLDSEVPYGRRSLLLRVLLGDPFLLSNAHPPRWAVANLITFLKYHPRRPLDLAHTTMRRDDIPSHLGRWLGCRRPDNTDVLVWLADVANRNREMASTLAPAIAALRVHVRDAELVLRGKRRQRFGRVLFGSAPSGLAFANRVTFLRAFVSAPVRHSRVQNRIPVDLSMALGLRRLCIPELLIACDVMGLAATGIIDTTALDPSHDFLGLRNHLSFSGRRELNPDTVEGMRILANHFLLDPDRSDAMVRPRHSRHPDSLFYTGLLFNPVRLLSGPRAAHRRFAQFLPYYTDALDTGRLQSALLSHYRRLAPTVAARLAIVWSGASPFDGVAARAVANILYHVHRQETQGQNRYTVVPTVGRYLLGLQEPSRRTRRREKRPVTRRNRPGTGEPRPLPLLDELLPPTPRGHARKP